MPAKFYTILFVLLFFISCKSPEYDIDVIDLNDVSFNLNAEKFYAKSQNREYIKFTSEKQFVEKDTLTAYDMDLEDDKKQIVSFQYNVKTYAVEDSVAIFKGVYFGTLSAMTDEKYNLMLLNAITKCDNATYDKLMQQLIKEYGKPEITEKTTGFVTNKLYTWTLKDRLIQIIPETVLDLEDEKVLLTEKDKEYVKDIQKSHLKEIYLFICDLKYEERLRGKLHSGSWLHFE